MNKSSNRFDKPRDDSLSQSQPLSNAWDEGSAIESVHVSRPFELTQPLEAAPVSRSSSAISMLWRPALIVAILAGLAFLVVGKPWAMRTNGANKNGRDASAFWSLFLAQASAEPAHNGSAALLVTPVIPRRMGESVPLGVTIRNSFGGTLLLIVKGFDQGTRLSAGFALTVNEWGLFAVDLKDAMVQPPSTFVGVMNLTIELFGADGIPLDRQMLRFEWVDAEVPEAKVPQAALKSEAIDKLASNEIVALLKRGNDLISSGDLAAARLVLRRVAEAGDARAALALATTYDPVTLKKFQVHGLSPDLAMARHWYEKASELGSQDALKRLEALAIEPE